MKVLFKVYVSYPDGKGGKTVHIPGSTADVKAETLKKYRILEKKRAVEVKPTAKK